MGGKGEGWGVWEGRVRGGECGRVEDGRGGGWRGGGRENSS